MIIEKKIEQLVSKFPQLPTPSYWNKYEKIRYYFNKKEGAQDYTFFIDFTEKNNPQILLNRLNFRWIIMSNNFLLKFNSKEIIKNINRQNGKVKVKNYDNKN